jgi:hsp70-interacting protein
MSEEDRKFLEEVMKNGIINEGERMKTILNSLVRYLDAIKEKDEPSHAEEKTTPSSTCCTKENVSESDGHQVTLTPQSEEGVTETPLTETEIETLLQELQDIVEQIDYARSFAGMGGLPFLIGCASQVTSVPESIRAACLAVLGTLNQNNPAVQYTMLEQGNIPKLVNLYFSEYLRQGQSSKHTTTPVHAAALQAMSCSVRNHDMAEKIFCMNQEAMKMIESALGLYSHHSTQSDTTTTTQQPLPVPTDALKRKALFFLQALVTSDSSDASRVASFQRAIQYVSTWYMDPSLQSNSDIRETTLSMLTRILDQKKSVNAILDIKSYLVDLGVRRVQEIRALQGEEKENMLEELKLWELLISQLATAVRDELNPNRDAEILMLPMKDDRVDILPQ